MTDLFKAELAKAANVKEMFIIIEKHYEIENAKPGFIVKQTLINGLINGIKITQAKERKK